MYSFRRLKIKPALNLIAAFVAVSMIGFGGASAQSSFGLTYAGADIHLDMQTFRDRKFARVVQQETDFSCGSAALATLLTYHYNIDTSEKKTFKSMWAAGDQESIRQRGFSLLDMKRYLDGIGLQADGFSLSLEQIEAISVPAIALINVQGYKHFVVIKGIEGDRILIGDPSKGLVARPRKTFEDSWDGTIFFIRSYLDRGRAGWNLSADWAAHPTARIEDGATPSTIQEQTLDISRPYDSAFGFFGRF